MWGILQPHKHNFGVGVGAHGPYGLVIPELFLHFFLMRAGLRMLGEIAFISASIRSCF